MFEDPVEAKAFFRSEGWLLRTDATGCTLTEASTREFRTSPNFRYLEKKRLLNGAYLLRREALKMEPSWVHSEAQHRTLSVSSKSSPVSSPSCTSPTAQPVRRKDTSADLPQFFHKIHPYLLGKTDPPPSFRSPEEWKEEDPPEPPADEAPNSPPPFSSPSVGRSPPISLKSQEPEPKEPSPPSISDKKS